MQRRLCEMSEAKWSITEAKCLQMSHNKYASQRDAISYSMGDLMLSHSAGMHNTDKSIAGISKRFHFASLHYIFSAYLPTHIKFLTEFRCIFFRTTCISFPKFEVTSIGDAASCYIAVKTIKGSTINWHCLIIFIRKFFYPTFTPGFTSPWGPMTTRRPSASSALRIMPWLSMPLSLRGGKLAMKHTSLPIKSAGS